MYAQSAIICSRHVSVLLCLLLLLIACWAIPAPTAYHHGTCISTSHQCYSADVCRSPTYCCTHLATRCTGSMCSDYFQTNMQPSTTCELLQQMFRGSAAADCVVICSIAVAAL
eukprot:GHUV01028238.1.p1 GENE.GHUV01028238.1~~GHUV01028238.1.p1  ORF type:complete len:113 (-),score=15.32 GHUV01028238.1:710-1048(-)